MLQHHIITSNWSTSGVFLPGLSSLPFPRRLARLSAAVEGEAGGWVSSTEAVTSGRKLSKLKGEGMAFSVQVRALHVASS